MLKDNLNNLISIATSSDYSKDIVEARNEYQLIAGNIFEDDKSYENRMALFLEWYIFDRISSKTNQTLLETLIKNNKETWSSATLKNMENFKNNIHGLFLIKKIREHSIKIVNLFNDQLYEAKESMAKLLFNKNGIFEGRLVLFENAYYFTGNYCIHPEKSKKFIKKEVKQVNKAIHDNVKELKELTKKLDRKKNQLNDQNILIEKKKIILQKTNSVDKIEKLKTVLDDLENMRSSLEESRSSMETVVNNFNSEIIIHKNKLIKNQLIQKLAYMQLAWERSRMIDLNDIYCK